MASRRPRDAVKLFSAILMAVKQKTSVQTFMGKGLTALNRDIPPK